jgi:signal transduction histidine kinase
MSVREYRRAVGRTRRAQFVGLEAAAALGVIFVGVALIRAALPPGSDDQLLLAYEVALCGLAIALVVGLAVAPWERVAVTDLVVELGEARSGTLRGELARAVGDPSLNIGFWLSDENAFVDDEGRPLVLPQADQGRSVTMIERDGQRIAALIHDAAVLEDPGVKEAVASATQLAATNARLQAEVRAQLTELEESRRRILAASDAERERLSRRLHQGAEARLERLGEELRATRGATAGTETAERVTEASAQLAYTLEDLRELAGGLHPRILADAGLRGALRAIADRTTLPMTISVEADGLPAGVEAAAYFVCSEGIANIVKYASAANVRVTVRADEDVLRVEVEDDGIGGADLSGGSGLRGLADRVEALGGTLRVDSPSGAGTRLTADIPIPSVA